MPCYTVACRMPHATAECRMCLQHKTFPNLSLLQGDKTADNLRRDYSNYLHKCLLKLLLQLVNFITEFRFVSFRSFHCRLRRDTNDDDDAKSFCSL